ncbi:hypothetical protein AgCh_003486 [Apium graveolens]
MGSDSKQPNIPTQTQNLKHSHQALPPSTKGTSNPKMVLFGGVAVLAGIAYTILYSHKKPEATASDVAKVASGTAGPEHTHPRK